MTETITIDAPARATTSARSAADAMLNVNAALLVPMFLIATGGDVDCARLAAKESIIAYQAANQVAVLAVAQIVAFGLAALGSLGLSMGDNLTVAMALRLRGNAIALNRSAEQNRRAAAQPHTNREPRRPDRPEPVREDSQHRSQATADPVAAPRMAAPPTGAPRSPDAPVSTVMLPTPLVTSRQQQQDYAILQAALMTGAGNCSASQLAHNEAVMSQALGDMFEAESLLKPQDVAVTGYLQAQTAPDELP